MESSTLSNASDFLELRSLISLPGSTISPIDFEEQILLPSVRATARIWQANHCLVGFAYLDDANNLWFETRPDVEASDELEAEIVTWGVICLARRNQETGLENSLDCVCPSDNHQRLQMLAKHGFDRQDFRSLKYERLLEKSIPDCPPPHGFSIRPVRGKPEAKELVALHRAAFGTEHMTITARLAMMSTSQYHPDLDLVAVASDGQLAAFCVCGFEVGDQKTGYTDPIGTHPQFRRQGLGRAIVTSGLSALREAGAAVARFGTGSDNIAMQRLGEGLGYRLIAEKLWFSKRI